MKSRKEIVLESMESDVITLEDGYQYFDTTKGGLSAADLRDIADELDRRNAEWDAKVRATLGDGQPTRKFTGTVAAGSGYDWDAATFEFEVPDDATDDDIRKAAYAAAWEECQVDYDEVKPRKKREKKTSELGKILDPAAKKIAEQMLDDSAKRDSVILKLMGNQQEKTG